MERNLLIHFFLPPSLDMVVGARKWALVCVTSLAWFSGLLWSSRCVYIYKAAKEEGLLRVPRFNALKLFSLSSRFPPVCGRPENVPNSKNPLNDNNNKPKMEKRTHVRPEQLWNQSTLKKCLERNGKRGEGKNENMIMSKTINRKRMVFFERRRRD